MSNRMHQAVRTNFIEKAAYVAHLLPTMAVVDCGSFVSVDCGLPSDTFNVLVARDLSATDRLLAEGVGYFMAKRFPMALWYWEDVADRHGMDALTAYGLVHVETHVAMAADLTQARSVVAVPAGLTIRAVTQAEEVRQYGAVIAELFGDADEGRQITAYFDLLSRYPVSHFPALRTYIGIVRAKVVATGTLFVGHDTIGIYDIVTQADQRRQGIGSAMFAHLVEEARRFPHRYAVLQASPDGIGIYGKAGFLPTGTVHTFENRGLL